MARHLHFDCFNGISGDMTLGMLVDLGLDLAELERRLSGLPIGGFRLRSERIKRQGIMGTLVHVEVEEDPHKHAHLRHIVEKVRAANLGDRPTARAIAAYELIADAEAVVHGSTREKIHFHEVGAKDAILDVAGAMVGVEMLGIETFSASVVAVGNGTVKCQHGIMPVPAPATAEILKGLPTTPTAIEGELTTPTGAAILRTLAGDRTGSTPVMRTEKIGYGAGTRVVEGHPNYLRGMLGELAGGHPAAGPDALCGLPVEEDEILIIETEIDDMQPEITGHILGRLLTAGARDVQFQSVQMKKDRPGQQIRVLCLRADVDRLAEIIFRETSTFGVRVTPSRRLCLRRRMESVETPVGRIGAKVGLWGESVLKVSPEFEDCREAATRSGRPLREVYDLARRAIEDKFGGKD